MWFYGLQVRITHAETKDGSGGPLDYEDQDLEDALFPRHSVESERTFPKQRQHPYTIEVSQSSSFSLRAACHHS